MTVCVEPEFIKIEEFDVLCIVYLMNQNIMWSYFELQLQGHAGTLSTFNK